MLGAVPIPSPSAFARLADEAYDAVPPARWEEALAAGGLPYVITMVTHSALKIGYISGVKAAIASGGGAGILTNASQLPDLFARIKDLRERNPDASIAEIADMIRREEEDRHAD